MCAALLFYILKVNVDPIQTQVQSGVHHHLDHPLPFGGVGENLVDIHIRPGLIFVVKIVPDTPDLQPLPMGLLHILAAGKGAEIPFIVRKAEPGGRDHIEPLPLRRHCPQGIIASHAADGMPAQDHLSRHGHRSVLRRRIVRHRCLGLLPPFLKALVLYITYDGVGSLHPAPGLHLLQHFHLLPGFHLPEYGAFNASQKAHLGILCHLRRALCAPLGIDLQLPVIFCIRIICEQPHIIRCHIHFFPLCIADCICCGMSPFPVGVFPGPKQCGGRILRRGIQELLLIDIRVKTLVKAGMHRVQVKIYHITLQHSLLRYHFILENDGQFPFRHLKICVQVSLFFAVGIFIQKLPPETYGSHHCDQYQCHNYRYYLFFHRQLLNPFSNVYTTASPQTARNCPPFFPRSGQSLLSYHIWRAKSSVLKKIS